MYRYINNISEIGHFIINSYLDNKRVAIDATLGNGHDTDYLSSKFQKVYAFDIQKSPCEIYMSKEKDNVKVINDSHHKFKDYIKEPVDCIVYNLGYLPGGDKDITTICETSLLSIKIGLELLDNGGIMAICIYKGHNEGKKEESCILSYVKSLPKNDFGVMEHSYLNRDINAPTLIIIEKNNLKNHK
ncbi:class I SAM-dependent methyltransferase [Clostridium sp.]|uniref:tRNA (mnm(5)s(2)U34)-methyltransferase n=1 Tax=Clostridium sp. TaxID=1506 RepID=UPI00261DA2F6|nr:class I SAM-dependent methyltransferase [Clostridium sp.]